VCLEITPSDFIVKQLSWACCSFYATELDKYEPRILCVYLRVGLT